MYSICIIYIYILIESSITGISHDIHIISPRKISHEYPLVICYIAIENGTLIVDLSLKNVNFP